MTKKLFAALAVLLMGTLCFAADVQSGKSSATVLGDINGDNTVDILDAITLSNSFGAILSSPRWNSGADLNLDGVINSLDSMILSSHFGNSGEVDVQMLRGVLKYGFEFANPALGNWRDVDPQYYEFDADNIAGWGCNLVRVPFNSYWYMNDTQYRRYVMDWALNCTAQGLYVIMDLQSYNDPVVPSWQITGLTEAQSWQLYNSDILPTFNQVVKDFIYEPKVIGIECNELYPIANDMTASWTWVLKMNNDLAASIHKINPDIYVLADVYGEVSNDSVINSDVNLVTERKVVFCPHIYCAELEGVVLHPVRDSKYGNDSGWDFWYEYNSGNLLVAKQKLYHWLDLYELAIQQKYNVSFVVTEFGSTSKVNGSPVSDVNSRQSLKDLMEYFKAHNWGFVYFCYCGDYSNPSIQALESDWKTPSQQGRVFIDCLR